MSTPMTIKAFVNRNAVKMSVAWADANPNMGPDSWTATASHWRCTIRRGRRSMLCYFSQGVAHTGEPSIEDVISALADESASYENAHSFEDWAGELGYDTDSRKAERTYRIVAFVADEGDRRYLASTEERMARLLANMAQVVTL